MKDSKYMGYYGFAYYLVETLEKKHIFISCETSVIYFIEKTIITNDTLVFL